MILRYNLKIYFKKSYSKLEGDFKTLKELDKYINDVVDETVQKAVIFDRANNNINVINY